MWAPDELESMPIDRTVFLPGATTDGHYQIELACESCHVDVFSDRMAMQEACEGCHSSELARVDDSHPRTKFTDPRNADRVEILDARLCITCHQEHRPEITSSMGLSLPGDYCYRCHENIGEERPTHADLPFDSCANTACHNFHDNRSLYEDFLVEHRAEPELRDVAQVRWKKVRGVAATVDREPLSIEDHDGPANDAEGALAAAEWASSAHARGGVQCTDCHSDESGAWQQTVDLAVCQDCHTLEAEGFLASRHGMRVAEGLAPMQPANARLPMQPDAAEAILDCNACHTPHATDRRTAAAEACLSCHADDHSLAWEASPHAALWRDELAGAAPEGSGVSCATCHLPRTQHPEDATRMRVDHNQNDHLRPRDKMVRSSCMECHGLAFSLDSLADPALVSTNYRGRPSREVESIHFATVLRWRLEGRTPPWDDAMKDEER